MRILLLLLVSIFSQQIFAETIHREQSLYRNIIVTKEKQKLCMRFSLRRDKNQNQSCKLINQPNYLVFDYAKLAVAGFLAADEPESILIIGLGGGTLVEAFHALAPKATITSVEIDAAVIKVAKEFFNIADTSWHKIIEKDGRIFIKREKLKNNKYDLIILDAFNGDYIPEHLMTLEFFQEVKSILSDKGLVIANTFSTSKLYDYESATYKKAFGKFYQFKGRHSGNRVILTSNQPLPTLKTLQKRAKPFENLFIKMDINVDYLWRALDTTPKWNTATRHLSDEYAPVNILRN